MSFDSDVIDLRSDTVTQPTPAMRKAMAEAEVGDDVYGEDPTINRLEALAAERMGKEAGLLIPSGTMGNLVAVLVHCQRGDEAIMGNLGHTFLFEAGGIAALGGVHTHTLPNQPDGTIELDAIRAAVRGDDIHFPNSRLLILENTHNRCGGIPLSVEYTEMASELAHQNGLKVHLDGARIFNAAAAWGVPASELAAPADSITFCLSKGLCAPVGSLLCGTQPFIDAARRVRKQLGGGMRQAGILAAAGIRALDEMTERIKDDHRRARALADGLDRLSGLAVRRAAHPTNMVFVSLTDEAAFDERTFGARLRELGVLVGVVSERTFRLVTHYWIDDDAVQQAVARFGEVLSGEPIA
jgi:threonine aldolase